MILFKTSSDQNNRSKRTLHQSFEKFLGEHIPEPHSISVADIIISI